MRKGFKLYATIWGAFYAIVIVGLIVAAQTFGDGISQIGAFWGGYAGILVAFLGQFICSCFAIGNGSDKSNLLTLFPTA